MGVDEAIKSVKIEKELIDWLKTDRFPNSPFLENDLSPPLPDYPTITLHRQQVIKFRNDYTALLAFGAKVCGVKIKDFSPLHMIKYLFEMGDRF